MPSAPPFVPRGEAHWLAKLTNAQVADIRKRYVKGSREAGTVALAREFNVDHKTIWNIVNGKAW